MSVQENIKCRANYEGNQVHKISTQEVADQEEVEPVPTWGMANKAEVKLADAHCDSFLDEDAHMEDKEPIADSHGPPFKEDI